MPANYAILGTKFGNLTAVEETDKREEHYTVWKCLCDCGNYIYASTKQLKQGTVSSCGCKGSDRRRGGEDISGQRFGKLVAVSKAERAADDRTRWLCRCDCGNMKTVRASALKRGKVKSCGCYRPFRGKDLSNRRFSRLLVLYRTDKRSPGGSVIWHCRCDCGNELDVSASDLVSGNNVSCGCRRDEIRSQVGDTLTFVDGTCIEWLTSRKWRSDNTTGHTGVSETSNGTYVVYIGFKRKRYFLGKYDQLEKAVQVRKDAEVVVHDGFVKAYRRYSEYAKEHPEWAEQTPFIYDVAVGDNYAIEVVSQTEVPC